MRSTWFLISLSVKHQPLQNLPVPISLIRNDFVFKGREKQNALFVVLGGYSSLDSRAARILLFFDPLITSGPLQSASVCSPPSCWHKQGRDKRLARKMPFLNSSNEKISQQSLWLLSSGNDKLRWGTDSPASDPSEQSHRSQPMFQLALLWGYKSMNSFIFLIYFSAIKQIAFLLWEE